MIQNAKYFTFNNRSLSTFEGMRIGTEDNNLYSVQIISNRRLIEEKIPGRKAPYFYNVDDDPLTLEITVALEQPKLVSELRPFFQWLYNNTEYKELWFDTDKNKIFYAMFIGSPTLHYIEQGTTNENDRSLIGYIQLTARCNAGSAYGPAVSTFKIFSDINPVNTLFNTGDNFVYSSIRFTTPADRYISSEEEGGTKLISSTADGIREIDDNQYVYNRRLLYDSSKSWGYNQYSDYFIEVLTTYDLGGGSTAVETQMRRIDFSTDEGLYSLTPWTKSIYGFGQTGVSDITYRIRDRKNAIADSGVLSAGGLSSIRDATKNWTDGQWIDGEYVIVMMSGNARDQVRKIIGNDPADPKTLLIGENVNLKGLSDRWGYPRTVDGITTTSQLPTAGDSYRIYQLETAFLQTGTPESLNHARVLFDKDRSFGVNQYANTLLAIMEPDNKTIVETYLITSNTKNTITIGEDLNQIITDETLYQIRSLGTPTGGGNTTVLYKVPFNVQIKNLRNNDTVYFTGLEPLDVVEIDMSTRRITAQNTAGIYERWNRSYLKLEPGANNIQVIIYETNPTEGEDPFPVANDAQTSVTFTYQPIRYL